MSNVILNENEGIVSEVNSSKKKSKVNESKFGLWPNLDGPQADVSAEVP